MVEAAIPFDPATGGSPVNRPEAGHSVTKGDGEGGEKSQQNQRVQPSRQGRQRIEERDRDENPDNRGRRPKSRPQAFPKQRRSGQPQQQAVAA